MLRRGKPTRLGRVSNPKANTHMNQPAFIWARDSRVTDETEHRRLSSQSLRILHRLQQGPATARELSVLSLKYTSRVSDLRKAGYVVQCEHDTATGRSVYRLEQA